MACSSDRPRAVAARPSVGRAPARIGRVGRDRRGDLAGVRPEILLVDDAVVVHEEGHDAGAAALLGPGDRGEAGDEISVDHVAVAATGCGGALPREDAIAIRVVGSVALRFGALPLERAEGARLLAVGRLPVEAVALSRRAEEPRGEAADGAPVARLRRVTLLRVHVVLEHRDGR